MPLIGIPLFLLLKDWVINTKSKRDAEGYTQEDRFKQKHIWNSYAATRLMGIVANVKNQTELFFAQLSTQQRQEFTSSTTNQLIQFGMCTGNAYTDAAQHDGRCVIAYEYAQFAQTYLKTKSVVARAVNLNAVLNDELAYQQQLEFDFNQVSDVLFIRILEYLEPEAAQLLLLSTMNLAKPGSRFYIEVDSPVADVRVSNITIAFALKPGKIASFFAHRPDVQVAVLSSAKNDNDNGVNTIERLLLKKQ